MINQIRNSIVAKAVSAFLILSFLTELIYPVRLLALTGGPSQPEMAGFTPVNTSDMVDLFSGDFHYTIPVMTVPGPNGGYPIHLNYNSGIGMEHEASWVGLGWNLNPGAVNRQVRGIPDDFNGGQDQISKKYLRRNNTTFVFSPGFGAEVAGADFGIGLNMSQSLIYNTYRGISLSSSFGIAASYIRNSDVQGSKDNKITTSLNANLNFDSDNGITPSFSLNAATKDLSYGKSFGFNSKSGTYTFGTSFSVLISGHRAQMGRSYSTAAVLPPIPIAMRSTSFAVSGQAGGQLSVLEGYGSLAASISVEETPSGATIMPAYGFCYAENAIARSLQDFNREKELSVDKNSLNLPLPVMTPDIYSIAGEGMSGSFRAYRSGIGYISNAETRTVNNTFNIGADAGFGGGFQVGVNLADNVSDAVSGPWNGSAYSSSLLKYKNKDTYAASGNKSIDPTLYEPFYFKMSGEQTGNSPGCLDYIGGEQAVAYSLRTTQTSAGFNIMQTQYSLENQLVGKDGTKTQITKPVQANRSKRTQSVEYRTNGEIGATTAVRKAHHIGEISVVNGNGERYTYSKAAYNTLEKEVSFSLPRQILPGSLDSSTTKQYGVNHASGSKRVGKEKLYSETITPAYAYSYLITSITSPDYVDVDGNGPSEQDLGYWVKFDYNKLGKDYTWRFPYEGANLSLGDPSNRTDDIGSYTYGKKEVYYVKTVETKTHIAKFYTSARQDGYEAKEGAGEYKGGRGSQSLHKLDSICLFAKTDPAHSIKTAVFCYSYVLCGQVPNHIDQKGKLTLDSVYFKYNGSEKGMETPYKFTYSPNNPNYNPVKMDRWGNYKLRGNYYEHYVSQDPAEISPYTGSWSLKRITLPSGGIIEVEYESDDYAYVQSRQAMYMAELLLPNGFEKEDGAYYVYFRKKEETHAPDYVNGFKGNLMFFKIAVAVEEKSEIYDYVQGYIKIKSGTAKDLPGNVGKVEVEPFEAYNKVHPIYFLCCQYLKNNRPDILFDLDDAEDNATDAKAFFKAILSRGMGAKAASVYDNKKFYNFCKFNKYFTRIIPENSRTPSYLRLNVADKIKYGGGERVKRITMYDNWQKSEGSAYTQEYIYRMMEGEKMISSGVAEYEPAVCGEETALRYPVYDEVKGMFFKENEIYSEEPYGESYFPGAGVGYSKVIVKTSVPANAALAASGIQMQEFYTAKDFPITVSQTTLTKKTNPLPNVLKMLTAGFKQVSASGFSQGYQIELNDMHGKTKRVATYPYRQSTDTKDLLEQLQQAGAVTEVAYYYKTKNGKLDNRVSVLVDDNRKETQILGQTYDFTTDLRENYSRSEGIGMSGNFGMPAPPTPAFYICPFPSYDCFEETVRSVATTKVIYNTGILEKTVANNNGSVITTQNLQWDPYTGQVLLSSITNDFQQPVYNYSMPAYWSYSNLGAASDNYRASYKQNWSNSALLSAFDRYDHVVFNGSSVYKTADTVRNSGSSFQIKAWNESGSLSVNWETPNFVEVLRSRNSNQLNAVSATTASLSDPLGGRKFPFFDVFNTLTRDECFAYHECSGKEQCARIAYYNNKLYFIKIPDCDLKLWGTLLCSQTVNIPEMILQGFPYYIVSPAVTIPNFSGITGLSFKKNGRMVSVYNRKSQALITSFEWKDPQNIFQECLEDVLQASAVEFSPVWKYDYADAGMAAITPGKEKYFGIPGNYRSLRSSLFVVDRKQTGAESTYKSNAAHDGIFDFFAFFNHDSGNSGNLQNPWTWTAEVSKYSPFNFEIENRNALGIYASALYGYGNSLATAVSNNARYYETGFDGFENDRSAGITQPRGHLKYTAGTISDTYAHTGQYSLRLYGQGLTITAKTTANGTSYTPTDGWLTLIKQKKYLFSCWVRDSYFPGLYYARINGVEFDLKEEEKIEGWRRLEFEFEVPVSGTEVTIFVDSRIKVLTNIYYDDIRILPVNGSMKSYVYNPANARLVAELDENNYATFYNYDEEGILVQVKKETVKGVRTIQTTRQYLNNR